MLGRLTTEMRMTTKLERYLRSFEAVQIALAIEDAKYMPTTAEIERQVQSLYAAGRKRLADIRQQENAALPSPLVSGEVRAAILSMARDEVIARLRELRMKHPDVQYAHRDFSKFTDHDLRSMLEDATRLVDRKG